MVREFVDYAFLIVMYSKIDFDPVIVVTLTAHDSLVTVPRDYIIIVVVVVVIIINNNRHELGLNRPVSASSNSFFIGLLSFLLPFGL